MIGAADANEGAAVGGETEASAKSGGNGKIGWIVAGAFGVLFAATTAGAWYLYDQVQRRDEAVTAVLSDISMRAHVIANEGRAAPSELAFLQGLSGRALDQFPPSIGGARLMFALASAFQSQGAGEDAARAATDGAARYAAAGMPSADAASHHWLEWIAATAMAEKAAEAKQLDEAAKQYDTAAQAAAMLATLDSGNAHFQRAMLEAHVAAGNALLATEDSVGAKTRYEAAVAAAAKQDADIANSSGIRRILSAAQVRLGDIAQRNENRGGAAGHYTAALAHIRPVAEANATNARTQRELWNVLVKLGDLESAAEDKTAARAHYQEALGVATIMTGMQGGERYRRDLLTSQTKLGDLARRMDAAAGATAYESALETGRALVAEDPSDIRAQRAVVQMLYRLGDIARHKGDKARASQLYAEGVATATVAATIAPNNAQLQNDIATGKTRQERL